MRNEPKGSRAAALPTAASATATDTLGRLSEPPAPASEPSESSRLQERLLPRLLLFLIVTVVILLPVTLAIPGLRNSAQPPVFIATALLLSLAYWLTRSRRYGQAAMVTVAVTASAVWLFAFSSNMSLGFFSKDLFYVVISIVLCGLMLPVRFTAYLAAAHLTGIILSGFFLPSRISSLDAFNLVIFVGLISALTVVTTALRGHDQRELHRQSLSLRESEERFHLVSYATNDLVWDRDLLTGEIWRNQNVQRLFGFEPEQVLPSIEWWQEQIHPEDRDKVLKSIRAAIDEGEQFWSREYRHRSADGNYVFVFDRGYIIRDGAGKPIRMLGAMMDITARRVAEEVVRQESVHDPLTGLYNRRYMEEMLAREMHRTERNHQPISIILLDIDHFKRVNDTFGHAAGDALLRKLGGFLLNRVRGTDIACRLGGDEFVLILPNATLEVAHLRAERLREAATELVAEPSKISHGPLTFSLGVAVFPSQGSTADEIFKAADQALYAAKQAGRNRVAVAGKH